MTKKTILKVTYDKEDNTMSAVTNVEILQIPQLLDTMQNIGQNLISRAKETLIETLGGDTMKKLQGMSAEDIEELQESLKSLGEEDVVQKKIDNMSEEELRQLKKDFEGLVKGK